jgi:dsRNA-specific ribonuclease
MIQSIKIMIILDKETPYHCTVFIAEKEYGHGSDVTKQLARQQAAEAALEVLYVIYLCRRLFTYMIYYLLL